MVEITTADYGDTKEMVTVSIDHIMRSLENIPTLDTGKDELNGKYNFHPTRR